MYVYICVCVCLLYECMYVNVCVYVCVCMCVCVSICGVLCHFKRPHSALIIFPFAFLALRTHFYSRKYNLFCSIPLPFNFNIFLLFYTVYRRVARYGRYFGPGVDAEVLKVDAETRLVGIKLTTRFVEGVINLIIYCNFLFSPL